MALSDSVKQICFLKLNNIQISPMMQILTMNIDHTTCIYMMAGKTHSPGTTTAGYNKNDSYTGKQ